MGRIGGWFKKSDEKEKPASPSASNPYAQQQPASQSSPPPQYDPYTQYNGNQSFAQPSPSQGGPSGLPAGPRPGGLPSRVAPGPRTGTFDSRTSASEKSPPPQYSPYGSGTPSLGSAGATPVIPSNTSSPSMGTGFPREKYGAADGVGRNRFESPAQSPYDNSSSLPSQSQGGYGNLDSGRDQLFANYNRPSQQTYSPDSAQYGAPSAAEKPYVDRSQMTAEEKDQADYDEINSEIKEVRNATEDSLTRSLATARAARERNAEMMAQLNRQGDILGHANAHMVESEVQGERSTLNVKDLDDATGSMWKIVYARKRQEKLNEERLRQELEARQKRDDAQALKRSGFGRAQPGMEPKAPQTLGARANPEHRKKFVLEEEDEEQEERIDGKVEELSSIVQGIRMDGQQMSEVIERQNVLIESMGERATRIQDKVITTHNRMNRIR